jgi:hypothetical protein
MARHDKNKNKVYLVVKACDPPNELSGVGNGGREKDEAHLTMVDDWWMMVMDGG